MPLECFLAETTGLGRKRGPLLVQLPPSLAFDRCVAARFFDLLRSRYEGLAVCEPRHPGWFTTDAEELLVRYRVVRVAADPAPAPGADGPGRMERHRVLPVAWVAAQVLVALRRATMSTLADALRAVPLSDVWCIFDNTASGAALENARELSVLMHRG